MTDTKSLRSRKWFDNLDDPEMTALYIERYLNYGLTLEELRSGKPVIGIAQTGSDLSPCNRHHIELAKRTRDGIIAAGGIPMEIPVHPIQETGKRPTAMLDRNLAYLSLVESLYGYPIDGVVLTIGWVFGPAAAAVFATTRMLTRIPMQFSGLLTRASLPELTRSQVAGDHVLTARLMKLNMGLSLGVMIPAALALFLIGPTVISAISHGEMAQSRIAFGLLGLAAAFCAVWTTLGTRLIAVNRQSEFAFLALGLYLACALMPYVSPNKIVPVLVALVVADAVIALKTYGVRA